jgi:heme/copper-type cytochrome/quinol oxidase subunit 3
MATIARPYELPVNPADRKNPGWLVMVLVISTEALLFVFLLFSYFYLGSMATTAWPPGGPPDLRLALPNTIILLASSGVMIWAERGIRAGARGRLSLGLLIALVLGIAFLVIQGIEYSHKDFAIQTNAYGSLFFTITGFHGTHVFVGLLMIGFTLVRSLLGHFTAERHLQVTNIAMYWHFVDVVWLAVFTSLYLVPHLT